MGEPRKRLRRGRGRQVTVLALRDDEAYGSSPEHIVTISATAGPTLPRGVPPTAAAAVVPPGDPPERMERSLIPRRSRSPPSSAIPPPPPVQGGGRRQLLIPMMLFHPPPLPSTRVGVDGLIRRRATEVRVQRIARFAP